MKIKIATSILSTDKNNLQNDINSLERSADFIHIDVMDGKFVPPIYSAYEEIKNIKTKILKDVHLMVEHPLTDKYIDNYVSAGAEIISIHQECKDDINKVLNYIKLNGIKSAIAFNPSTPLEKIKQYLEKIDMVLIMSVKPGYSGQKFMPEVLNKAKELRKLKPNLDIEIDGGIDEYTIIKAAKAGVNIFVSGSYIFRQADRSAAINELKKIAQDNYLKS